MAKMKNHIGKGFLGYGVKLSHNQQFKVDAKTDDILAEISMQLYGGSRADMFRDMLASWLNEIYPRKVEENKQTTVELYLIDWYKYQGKQEIEKQLIRDYFMLQKRPDETLEKRCMELSKEYGLEWPPNVPDDICISDTNNELAHIKRRLNTMVQNSNSDTVTLRSLQRSLSRYTTDELRTHLAILSEHGEVSLFETPNSSILITVTDERVPF